MVSLFLFSIQRMSEDLGECVWHPPNTLSLLKTLPVVNESSRESQQAFLSSHYTHTRARTHTHTHTHTRTEVWEELAKWSTYACYSCDLDKLYVPTVSSGCICMWVLNLPPCNNKLQLDWYHNHFHFLLLTSQWDGAFARSGWVLMGSWGLEWLIDCSVNFQASLNSD